MSFLLGFQVPKRFPNVLLVSVLLVVVALVAASCSSTSVESFCDEVADLENADLQSLDTAADDDPAARAELQRISGKFNDVLAVAPLDIRPDVAILAGLTAALAEAVRETNSREPFNRAAALLAAQAPYEDVLDGAVDRYNAYVRRSCTPVPGSS